MYDIKRCSEVTDSEIFKAFSGGFSDYIIPFAMEEEFFIDRFFGAEGNDREISFIAYKNSIPVGVVIGGLKPDEKLKTLRCGGMCVLPEERGSGLALELMKYHKSEAKAIGCKQLFLEVIKGNDRAIGFYKKLGYEKVYDLKYRVLDLDIENDFEVDKNPEINVEKITFEELTEIRKQDFSHLPWQYSFEFFSKLESAYYGIKDGKKLVAGMATMGNKIYYLWVHPEYRLRKYGKTLVDRMVIDNNPDGIVMAYVNNSEAHTFANKLGMRTDDISQLEMYLLL